MNSPIKISFKSEWPSLLMLILAFAAGVYFYAHFPERVVSHWNFAGQPDGFSGKLSGSFAVPAMFLGTYLLFLALPYLDPKRERYAQFAKVYQWFKNLILLCLFVIFVATGLFNLGYPVRIEIVVPLVIGLMMIFLGNYFGKLKNNWFVGIKTPWTLSSEAVWNKTHRLGGRMFILFGLIIIVAPYLPQSLGLSLFMVGILLAVALPIGYSYWLYRQEKQQNMPVA